MEPSTITKGRYTYIHDMSKGLSEAVTVHHIIVPRNCVKRLIFCAHVLFVVTCFLLLFQDQSVAVVLLSFALAGFLLRFSLRKQVERESVVIFPAFGVQLETFYISGETVRRFVPIGKILKPVLNECVTPINCYWSLSLIISGQEELLPVFKELYPPVSMIVPIWKAMCAATANEEWMNLHSDCDTTKFTDKM